MGILILWNSGYTWRDGDDEWSKVLGWPGYRVYRHEIDERGKTLKLWVRRKRGNRKLVCSCCGRKFTEVYDAYEREIRDLPWSEYRTTVVIELYRVHCPDCGVKTEKVPQLPSKAPFSKRFEEAVGLACESAAGRRVAQQFRLAASTVRAIDLRYLQRWAAARRKPALRQMGVDEINGEETEVPHCGQQPGDRRTGVVWAGAEERNTG
jgi:transposase